MSEFQVIADRVEIRAGTERLAGVWEYFVQTTHPGTILLDGDTASGRAYVSELGRLREGTSMVNHGLFHDRYRRTPDGWKFTERLFEVRYFDSTPLPGSPHVVRPATNCPGDTMTTHIPTTAHTDPASDEQLKRAASALTAHGFTVEVLKRALAAGVRGFVPKTVSARQLAEIIRTVHAG
ncbi:nuclear transport factor 2 family protein, partial [Streptomyces niveus]|uniref:nuclear transport factor 2 family protein n=1 Tax=Streptomyces niveus TaxID=193462 RepID=UPI00342B58A2